LLGFTLLVGSAIVRLSKYVFEVTQYSLGFGHYAFMVLFTVFMLYSEGYRGFHQKLSPRFAARSYGMIERLNWRFAIFAPFFCVGYFYATRRRKMASYLLTAMIVILVLIVSRFAQPWRGMVDLGVVSGLVFGLGSLWYWWIRVMVLGDRSPDPEFPE